MHILIDSRACIGCEKCINCYFEVFRHWGMSLRASFEVADDAINPARVREALEACPVKAIRVKA
jgi:ferredoxin